MKLVSAKCPNCGAKISVPGENEKVLCQFCGYDIFVEDAIQKYKLEISGQIEVKNLPKIDNLMKLASRSYEAGDYEESYNLYMKILELDSEIPMAILRKGISKALLSSYPSSDIKYLIHAYKIYIDLEKNENEKQKSIRNTFNIINKLSECDSNFLSNNTITIDYVKSLRIRLALCIEALEIILQSIQNNQVFEKDVLIVLVRTIRIINKTNVYNIVQGKKTILPFNDRKIYNDKLKLYNSRLNNIEHPSEKKINKESKTNILVVAFMGVITIFTNILVAAFMAVITMFTEFKKRYFTISSKNKLDKQSMKCYIKRTKKVVKNIAICSVNVFFWMSLIFVISEKKIVSSVLFLILVLLTLKKVKHIIQCKYPKYYNKLWVLKLVIFIIACNYA